jgi:hypothetical protein
MKQNITLVGLVVGIIGCLAFLWFTYSADKARRISEFTSHTATTTTSVGTTTAPVMDAVVSTTTPKIKIYDNKNVKFSSPDTLFVNVDSDNQFILTTKAGQKESYIEFYVGKTGDCYMDFCKDKTVDTETINGVTWQYLGNPEYCDGHECSQPSALYKTTTANKDIYLAFFEYGPPVNKSIIFSTILIK